MEKKICNKRNGEKEVNLFTFSRRKRINTCKKCWVLENVRSLSAKQNLIERTNRVRHKVKRG